MEADLDSRGVITLDSVRAYQQKHGARQAEECLRRLGILQQFYNAYSLPLGRELLEDIRSSLVQLSARVLTDPNATDDDKAMFRAYSAIGQSWAKKINDYENTVAKIREAEDAR